MPHFTVITATQCKNSNSMTQLFTIALTFKHKFKNSPPLQ